MKKRIKKKGECAHYYLGESFLVTDDPYPIYNNELYCKLGKIDWSWLWVLAPIWIPIAMIIVAIIYICKR